MKKLSLLLGGLIVTLGATMASCSGDNAAPAFKTEQEKINFQAVTSLNLASSFKASNPGLKRAKAMTEEQKKEALEILPTLDLMLTNGVKFDSVTEEVDTIINEVTYKIKETINFIDTSLKEAKYTLYYNVVDKEEESEKNKVERETSIEGIAEFDSNQYSFISTTTTEEKNNKSEVEREFKVIIDENNYVKVEEEHEIKNNKEETSFEYSVYKDGKETLSYSLSIENKNHYDEIEYEVNDVEYELKIMKNEDGSSRYVISIEKEDEEFEAVFNKIIDENGNVSYVEVTK